MRATRARRRSRASQSAGLWILPSRPGHLTDPPARCKESSLLRLPGPPRGDSPLVTHASPIECPAGIGPCRATLIVNEGTLARRPARRRGVCRPAVRGWADQAESPWTIRPRPRSVGRLRRPMSGRLPILRGTGARCVLSARVAVRGGRQWRLLRAAHRDRQTRRWNPANLSTGRARVLVPRPDDLLRRGPALLHGRRCTQLLPVTTSPGYAGRLAGVPSPA
jgi:hypothetical protein